MNAQNSLFIEDLIDSISFFFSESNADESAPTGCVNERLNEFAPTGTLEHEELPLSLRSNGDGTLIPHQLQVFLETVKKQYLTFMKQMKVRSVCKGLVTCARSNKYFFIVSRIHSSKIRYWPTLRKKKRPGPSS